MSLIHYSGGERYRPSYADVNLEDAGNDLLSGEKIILHKEILYVPKKVYSINDSSNSQTKEIDKATQLYVNPDEVTSPPDFATFIVFNNKSFKLSLVSSASLEESMAWEIFTHSGIEYVKYINTDTKRNDVVSLIIENFKIKMKENCNFGFLQFYVVADKIRYATEECKKGSLMTFFFYKDMELYYKQPYPLIYPVIMTKKQTFAPLLPGQSMQLIYPANTEISFEESGVAPALILESTEFYGKIYNISTFRCQRSIESNENIYLQYVDESGKTKNAIVIVPPLRVKNNNKLYPVLTNPISDFSLYCYNVHGFVLKNEANYNLGKFLDKNGKCKIIEKKIHSNCVETTIKINNRISPTLDVEDLHGKCMVS